MTWRSRGNSRQGFTLVEVLVGLVIFSIAIGVVASRVSSGSDLAVLRDYAVSLEYELQAQHTRAIRSGKPHPFLLPDRQDVSPCEPAEPTEMYLFPDGSAGSANLCLSKGKAHLNLRIDWLSGEIEIVGEE